MNRGRSKEISRDERSLPIFRTRAHHWSVSEGKVMVRKGIHGKEQYVCSSLEIFDEEK